jgi:replicative superfamily II helicase
LFTPEGFVELLREAISMLKEVDIFVFDEISLNFCSQEDNSTTNR